MFTNKACLWLALASFCLPAASGADCVINKVGASGYTASVQWFAPGDITAAKDNENRLTFSLLSDSVKPSKNDPNVSVGQRSCGPAGHLAVVAVKGGRYANIGIGLAVGVGAAALCVAAGPGCAAAGTSMVFAAAGAGGTGYALGATMASLLPEPKGIILVGGLPRGSDAILLGTVYNAKVVFAAEEDYARDCTQSNKGYRCYNGDDKGWCGITDANVAKCVSMEGSCDSKCQEAISRKCTSSNTGYACYDGNAPGKCVMAGLIPDCKKN